MSLTTGYRKRLCYAALPHAFDLKRFRSIEPKRSIVLVLLPLLALTKDQVIAYSAKGLAVCNVTHETTPDEKRKISEDKYQLLFFIS